MEHDTGSKCQEVSMSPAASKSPIQHHQQLTWDSYIDNMMHQARDEDGKTHVSHACIIAMDGGGRWTSDQHPQVSF